MAAYLPGFGDPIPDPPGGGRADWRTCPHVHRRHREALDRLATSTRFAYPGGKGRGVVTVGGGKFWPGIVVAVRLLRELGCTLPIQVWHRGAAEPVRPEQVEGLGVEVVDATAYPHRVLGGWEAKLVALVNCPFETALFLDADAYCVADPAPLFAAAEAARFAFWKDLHGNDFTVKWPVVWPDGPAAGVPQIQGGQLAVHRESFWDELCLAHWMNQHSDFYYGHMFGDQDTWRVALAATGGTYRNMGDAGWHGTAFVCAQDGVTRVVHRCRGKLFRPADVPAGNTGYASLQPGLPLEGRVFDLFADALKGERDPALFGCHYRKGLWGGGSGTGSVPAEARPFVDVFNALAAFAGWKSAVDVGCGDGRVAAALRVDDYRGVDCTEDALMRFRANARDKKASLLDCYGDRDRLPAADVLVCRDVLHHWPNEWVTDWMTWVRGSGRWRHVLLCQDRNQWHDGQDCHLGGYRALDKGMEPLRRFGLRSLHDHLHKAVLLMECKP